MDDDDLSDPEDDVVAIHKVYETRQMLPMAVKLEMKQLDDSGSDGPDLGDTPVQDILGNGNDLVRTKAVTLGRKPINETRGASGPTCR